MSKKDKQTLTQKDLRKIRLELSLELTKMSREQKNQYFKAAREVYRGLQKMSDIARMVST